MQWGAILGMSWVVILSMLWGAVLGRRSQDLLGRQDLLSRSFERLSRQPPSLDARLSLGALALQLSTTDRLILQQDLRGLAQLVEPLGRQRIVANLKPLRRSTTATAVTWRWIVAPDHDQAIASQLPSHLTDREIGEAEDCLEVGRLDGSEHSQQVEEILATSSAVEGFAVGIAVPQGVMDRPHGAVDAKRNQFTLDSVGEGVGRHSCAVMV